MSKFKLKELEAALDRIGLEALLNPSKNTVYSPLGVVLAAGLLFFARDRDVYKPLLGWLGARPDTSDDSLAKALKSLAQGFKGAEGNAMYWQYAVAKGEKLSKRCLKYVETMTGVPVLVTKFPSPGAGLINAAVSETTKGLISEAVNMSAASIYTRFVVNALYLKRRWKTLLSLDEYFEWEFPDSSERLGFIGNKGEFKYASDDFFHYLSLPYTKDTHSEMEIFMTRDRSVLPLGLTTEKMKSLRKKASTKTMTVYIPPWEFRVTTNVLEVIGKAGVPLSFLEKENLSIEQKAFIKVDKEGTEAAAVTLAAGLDCLEMEDRDMTFVVNRPFIYTIRARNVTEFVGYLYNPKHDELSRSEE